MHFTSDCRRSLDFIFLEMAESIDIVQLTALDPLLSFIEVDADKFQKSDTDLKSLHISVPAPFQQPWSALLYKRHVRCLLPRLSQS